MQGPQLRKTSGSWGLRETTITKDQRTMDTNIHLPHNSLASLQTQSLPKNAPAVSPAWSLPPLQQCSPLDEPMSNNKQKLVSARTTPTQGERRFGGHTPVFNSPGSSLTFDSSSQVTQAYPAWATAAPDNSIRRHPVLQYSDFDQLSSSDEGHFRSYPSVPSFETIAIQSPRARRPLPVSPNTTPGRGVIDTERQRFYHDIEGNAHGATPVVHTDKAKPVNLIIRNNQPHSSAGSMSYASPSEATFQESRRGNINSTSAYVDAPGHVPQTTVPITPIRPPKGPAKVFEGIVDLDPGVTLFNTATGVVKSDISPQISLADSKSVERMLRIWNRKTSDDIEMKKLCEAEMRRLERK
ncbi:hypothetical protein EV426DRAFT_614971 [Tirmania nivea]|nr:hypothetical protein EV426DRAFT_614971 [Tirmania nivea]